ncbi:alpha/beta fold hydrolase [Desmospora activa]|uniref:Pimeloyl-ACP methyl ester carboxylesterase n=1 Tax=Desmospora activa DSM 45169 TaxID=1121389 RepID=A0A2T4ZCZ6_9BACL|nr:alpha/beta hydrolase [Desmospora activa]PTM59768.1 pimeloyl-ACP methyl ester carboxylesterase [Desmospora activa DSM 45169]
MSTTIYKSPAGEVKMMELYNKQLAKLKIEYKTTQIDTRFGSTHVIITGPEHAPPVLLFQGGNTTNPYILEKFLPLAKHFRLYAPDTVGHPGKSAQNSLSPRDTSYGKWAVDIMDGLGLAQASVVGTSWGGGILLQLGACTPERITKAVLIVPAGIANSSMRRVIKDLAIPMFLYQLFPNRKRLLQAIQPLASDPDEDTIEMVQTVFHHVKVKAEMPGNVTKEELAAFTAPTMLFAAENDIIFPANRVIPQAKKVIPNLTVAEQLNGASHLFFQSYDQLQYVQKQISDFLLHAAKES